MQSALQWVRDHAVVNERLSDILEYDGRKYRSVWRRFYGRLPYRMRKELTAQASQCERGEYVNEVLRLICTPSGHQTGDVEFTRITYEPL